MAKLRDIRITEHNLWDQRTFQLYLNGYGLLEKWKETACPKMCQSAIAAFLCSQKFVKQRKNSFQLIRTDFVLTPDMTPWLTNVNPMPNMTVGGPAIIKNFTSECLDDLIRVVFDRAENPAAFTGNFELVYKQNYVAMKTIKLSHPLVHHYYDAEKEVYVPRARVAELLEQAVNAGISHNIFALRTKSYEPIRQALQNRGWLEKIIPEKTAGEESEKNVVLADHSQPKGRFQLPQIKRRQTKDNYIKLCEHLIMQRILRKFTPDLYWIVSREDRNSIGFLPDNTLINRIARPLAISKEKLYHCLRNLQWHCEPNVAYTHYPRCYLTTTNDYLPEFTFDYRITACISLLRAFIKLFNTQRSPHPCANHPQMSLPAIIIQFAINRCKDYISTKNHKDIDTFEPETIQHGAWERFLKNYYGFVHHKTKIIDFTNSEYKILYGQSKDILDLMSVYWPQYNIDGVNNIWIIKPGHKSMGRGIILSNNFCDIVDIVTPKPNNNNKYVIQKYVECPLLIYDTKFDIRQWFLVTSVLPLEIWMYKKCYLRFSSEKFTLTDFSEAIHITNNSVQRRYQESSRNSKLPPYNMWSSDEFILYLENTTGSNNWQKIIYPKMKEAIIGAMLVCQDNFDTRINSFELFGADFILTPDYNPWLLEVNSGPDLSATTTVTAMLCPECLEDIIKVVIDRQRKSDAPTGNFELIYRQSEVRGLLQCQKEYLRVKGKQILLKPSGIQQVERNRSTSNLEYLDEELYQPSCAMENIHKTEEILKRLNTPADVRKITRKINKTKTQKYGLKSKTDTHFQRRTSRNKSSVETTLGCSLDNIHGNSTVANVNKIQKTVK